MYVNKKPMDVISGPIYPFIQRDPQRFYKTKKHWMVHPDDIVRQQQDNTQLFDGSILAVSRDENKNRYGQKSYHSKVNKEFRPPLIDPEYDLVPLSRIPRPRTQLRINPNMEGVAEAQNIHGLDVSKHIDHRVLKGSVRPTFTIALEKPIEQVLPDLRVNLPQVAGRSYVNTPMMCENDRSEIELQKRNPDVFGSAGMNAPFEVCQTPLEDIELNFRGPQVSAASGVEAPHKRNASTPLEDLDLQYTNPQVAGKAGMNAPAQFDASTPLEDLHLQYKAPQVSGGTGMNTPYGARNPQAEEYMQLNFTNPQASYQTNPEAPAKFQDYTPQTINTQNPIQLPYQTHKNYALKETTHNEHPGMKQTLEYNRNFSASCNIPQTFQPQNPTLRSKNRYMRPAN